MSAENPFAPIAEKLAALGPGELRICAIFPIDGGRRGEYTVAWETDAGACPTCSADHPPGVHVARVVGPRITRAANRPTDETQTVATAARMAGWEIRKDGDA